MGARSRIGVRWWGARREKREPYRWGPQVEIRFIPMEPVPDESPLFDVHRETVRMLQQMIGAYGWPTPG